MCLPFSLRLLGAKDETESGWNVGEKTIATLSQIFPANVKRNPNTSRTE